MKKFIKSTCLTWARPDVPHGFEVARLCHCKTFPTEYFSQSCRFVVQNSPKFCSVSKSSYIIMYSHKTAAAMYIKCWCWMNVSVTPCSE